MNAIRVVLTVHVAADLLLVAGPWQFVDWTLLLAVSWPMSQNSLAALWASTSRIASYWLFTAAALGMLCTWFVAIAITPGIAIYGQESAGWAAGYATQSALVVMVVVVAKLAAWRIRARRKTADDRPRLQYSILFLLVWTALVALTLGLVQTACERLGWSISWEHFLVMPVLGAYSAVYGLVIFFSLAGRAGGLVGRMVAAATVVMILGWSEPYVLELLLNNAGGLTVRYALLLAGSQTVYLYATLLPLRVCGYLSTSGGDGRPSPASVGAGPR